MRKRSVLLAAALCAAVLGTVGLFGQAHADTDTDGTRVTASDRDLSANDREMSAKDRDMSSSDRQVTAAPRASCPANRVCIFVNRNFGGPRLVFPAAGGHRNVHAVSCSGCRSSKHPGSNNTWGDQTSSWINNTGTPFCAYLNANYGGGGNIFILRPHSVSAYVGNFDNDELSSIKAC